MAHMSAPARMTEKTKSHCLCSILISRDLKKQQVMGRTLSSSYPPEFLCRYGNSILRSNSSSFPSAICQYLPWGIFAGHQNVKYLCYVVIESSDECGPERFSDRMTNEPMKPSELGQKGENGPERSVIYAWKETNGPIISTIR